MQPSHRIAEALGTPSRDRFPSDPPQPLIGVEICRNFPENEPSLPGWVMSKLRSLWRRATLWLLSSRPRRLIRRLNDLALVLWVCRVSVVSLAIGILLLAFVPQARDLFIDIPAVSDWQKYR